MKIYRFRYLDNEYYRYWRCVLYRQRGRAVLPVCYWHHSGAISSKYLLQHLLYLPLTKSLRIISGTSIAAGVPGNMPRFNYHQYQRLPYGQTLSAMAADIYARFVKGLGTSKQQSRRAENCGMTSLLAWHGVILPAALAWISFMSIVAMCAARHLWSRSGQWIGAHRDRNLLWRCVHYCRTSNGPDRQDRITATLSAPPPF